MREKGSFLPEEFLQKMSAFFPGADFSEFQAACLRPLRKSIRVNTLKIGTEEFRKKAEEKGWLLTAIPWCSEGFWIDRAPEDRKEIPLGKTWEHALGLFYIQEASSMLPVAALQSKVEKLAPYTIPTCRESDTGSKACPGDDPDLSGESSRIQNESKVLDMAAAPGSKTTQLAASMENEGLIVANEFSASRIKKLFANLERCGVKNAVLAHFDGEKFGAVLPESFDAVLLDAPCTGEGTVRKDPDALRSWSERNIRIAAGIQKKLILSAFTALKPGGALVYSTCTLNREENEEVCFFLRKKFPDDVEFASLKDLFPGAEKAITPEGFLRIWPHLYDTEGFFVAKIRKKSSLSSSGLTRGSIFTSKVDSRWSPPRSLKRGGNDKWNNFPFTPLSSGKFQAIQSYYSDHFGFALPFSREEVWERNREVWLFPEEIPEFLGRIRFDRIGIKLCELHEKGVKTEHETALVFGKRFSRNVIALSAASARDFLAGKNIPGVPEKTDGEVLCTFQGFPLGLARVQTDGLKNLLPRTIAQEKVVF